MNVLSLFDGMSCGLVALKRAGFKVSNYHAYEIDKYAIQVAKKNHPEIQHHGSVVGADFSKHGQIDLLLAGSPCQGFSFAGKQLNFNDPRSALFFEFVRALKVCKPKYFLLENVKMKKEYQRVISDHLGVEPVEINSALVSAQNRERLYWFNWCIGDMEDVGVKLKDILLDIEMDKNPYVENYVSNKPLNIEKKEKFNCLRAQAGSRTRGIGICNNRGFWRKLTPIECERLQTVPDNYTNHVSNAQRYKMLGNGWTVDVIAHIFKGMKDAP